MITICAWCKDYISGEAEYEDEPVSHGACLICAAKISLEIEKIEKKTTWEESAKNNADCD